MSLGHLGSAIVWKKPFIAIRLLTFQESREYGSGVGVVEQKKLYRIWCSDNFKYLAPCVQLWFSIVPFLVLVIHCLNNILLEGEGTDDNSLLPWLMLLLLSLMIVIALSCFLHVLSRIKCTCTMNSRFLPPFPPLRKPCFLP